MTRCFLFHALLAVLFLLQLAPPALARRPRPDPLLAVERALAAGELHQALDLLDHLPRSRAHRPRAGYLRAYAHFKLDALDRAETALAHVDAPYREEPEVQLLLGMIAYRRGDLARAQATLDPVAASARQPWAAAAAKIVTRARQEQQQEQQAQERAVLQQFTQRLDRAKALLKAGRHAAAEKAIAEAEHLRPGQLLPRYYLGYIAYHRRDYPRARRHLEAALALDARDEWSRYMLAVTRAASGEEPRARTTLVELSRQAAQAEVRAAAGHALELLERPAPTPPPRRLTVALEAGSGLDTNPAYLDEVALDLDDAGLALHAAGRLGYDHPLLRALDAGIELRFLERAYAVGGNDAAQTDLAARLRFLLRLGRVSLELGYGYSFFLYGHQPLLSTHGGDLQLGVALHRSAAVRLYGRFASRHGHDPAYAFLEAIEAGGGGVIRLAFRRWQLEASYEVLRDFCSPLTETIASSSVTRRGPGPGSPTQTTTTVFVHAIDYSFLGHGPALWGRVRLPWRLELAAGIGLEWRAFVNPSTVTTTTINPDGTSSTSATPYDPRRDFHLSAEAELVRTLPHGLALALRFESLDNFSSLTDASQALDRNYSRRLAGLALRWAWPFVR